MQIPGGVIMPDSSRIAALEKRVSALEAVVEKFTSANSQRVPCRSCGVPLSRNFVCKNENCSDFGIDQR